MGITLKKEGQSEQKIAEGISFTVSQDSLLFYDLYKLYYQNYYEFDQTVFINAEIQPMEIKLFRGQYLESLKIFFYNIDFDDKMDNYFIFRYEKHSKDKSQTQMDINFELEAI